MTLMFKQLPRPSVLGVIAAAAFLTACSTLAPDYERPQSPVPDTWAQTSTETQAAAAAAELGWQAFVTDERLREVISLALQNNRDLRVAALNVERSQALYQVQRSELFPSVNVGGAQNAQRLPGDLSGTGQTRVTRQYSATVGVSAYELDLFGR